MATAFVRVSIAAVLIATASIVVGVFTHERWYWCLGFAATVLLAGWGFQALQSAWQKELARESAWLAIRALILESQEIERFKVAYSSRNIEEVRIASEAVQAAIRNLQ